MIVTVGNVSNCIRRSSHSDGFTDILIRQLMTKSNPLWLMLDRATVNDSLLELLDNRLVDSIALG